MLRLTILLVLLSVLPAHAADEFLFAGPAAARNFQPIQLIFLNLPFERAATIGRGRLGLQLDSAEINEIATTQGPIESALKFETNRTVLGARFGLTADWEVGIELPFISRYGGFLDPMIDLVEGVFGLGNIERDFYKNNTFGDFYVRRGDTVLFSGDHEAFEPGDLTLATKHAFHPGSRWPTIAVRAAVKVPSGDADRITGSGETDVGVGLAVDYRVFRRLTTYLNLNLVYPLGPITDGRLTLEPMFAQSFATELALFRNVSAVLHEAVYTSPMHDNGVRLLDGTPVEIGFGLNFTWSENLAFQILAIDNVSPVEPAADFSLLIGMKTAFSLVE